MTYFAVIREAGPRWDPEKPMREQPTWGEHAAFMEGLADEGFVVFGGPLAESDKGRVRALLIVSAASETEIRRRLDDDPWTPLEMLSITSVEPWEILLAPKRLAAARRDVRRPRRRAGDSR